VDGGVDEGGRVSAGEDGDVGGDENLNWSWNCWTVDWAVWMLGRGVQGLAAGV
jgi:hypothetical protein